MNRSYDDPDVDEITVERLVAGRPTPSTSAERVQATRVLVHLGHPVDEIARRLRRSTRTVERYRRHLRSSTCP